MKAEILPAPCPFCGSTNPGIEVVTARWNDRGDGDALRALREMAHDMDLLLELNAALKMETQWLAQGIRTQDEEHAMQIEHFAARVTELLETINALKKGFQPGRSLPVHSVQPVQPLPEWLGGTRPAIASRILSGG